MFRYCFKLLAVALIPSAIIALSCRTHHKMTSSNVRAVEGRYSAQRGRYLAMNMCAPCHYDAQTLVMSGKEIDGLPRIAGKIYSSSLTNEPNSTIAKYSDAALEYLIKTGINKDGHFVPYMMRPNLADQDLNDIIIFLRSQDPLLRPVPNGNKEKTHLTLAGRLGMRLKTHPQPYRTGIARPAADDRIELGKYLVDNMGCFHCHSASATSLNYLHPEKTRGYLAGGAKFFTSSGIVRGSNITPDETTGILNYTQEDMRRLLQQGITRYGAHVKPPAEIFPISNDEADAIYAYLRNIPPRFHAVKGQSTSFDTSDVAPKKH